MASTQRSETPIEIDLHALKRRKFVVSGGALIVLIGVLWLGHGKLTEHLDVYMISTAEGQVLTQQVKEAADAARQAALSVQEVGRSLVDYIKLQDIKDARERLNNLRGSLSETQLWESANGANDISRARKADLEAQISVIEGYIQCIEAGRSTCVQ
jgi:hypothetical protein